MPFLLKLEQSENLKFESDKLLKQTNLLTHSSAVGIWKAFVYSLSHEDPAVVLKLALYNFIVVLFQFFRHLLKKIVWDKHIIINCFLLSVRDK